jgi:hypothetical protein
MTLPKLSKAPVIHRGPRIYQMDRKPQVLGPPGAVPPGFVTPKTSATEWPPYWGLARITGYPRAEDVRKFPFVGGPPIWTYQAFAETGSSRASNIDFVVWGPFQNATPVAIRIQTEFFHNFTTIDNQIYDITMRDKLENGFDVYDIYDYEYMRDPSGAAIIIKLKQAMGLIGGGPSISRGTVQRV